MMTDMVHRVIRLLVAKVLELAFGSLSCHTKANSMSLTWGKGEISDQSQVLLQLSGTFPHQRQQ